MTSLTLLETLSQSVLKDDGDALYGKLARHEPAEKHKKFSLGLVGWRMTDEKLIGATNENKGLKRPNRNEVNYVNELSKLDSYLQTGC